MKKKTTKNTTAEIEAALAAATGAAHMPPLPANPCIENLDQAAIDEALGQGEGDASPRAEVDQKTEPKIEPKTDCLDLEIDAASCREESRKHEDAGIKEYIAAINRKINTEIQRGGFSVPIQFRVTTQDWVNINHILDWYKARGFQIVNFDATHPQYGQAAGTIEYNFSISWVN